MKLKISKNKTLVISFSKSHSFRSFGITFNLQDEFFPWTNLLLFFHYYSLQIFIK